jgi:hypothetical protein
MANKTVRRKSAKDLLEALQLCSFEPFEVGGRFGEDVISVRCKLCKEVTTDETSYRHNRTCPLYGHQPEVTT